MSLIIKKFENTELGIPINTFVDSKNRKYTSRAET